MNKLLTKYRSLRHYDVVNGKKYYTGRLNPDTLDHRDIKAEQVGGFFDNILGAAPYIPKHQRYIIPTLEIKDQSPHNTCGWNSVVSVKESSEQVRLSVRGLVAYARANGLLTGDGFSELRNNMKALVDFGVPQLNLITEHVDDWDEYSLLPLTDLIKQSAGDHKSKTFAQVSSGRDGILKLLDEDKPLHTGGKWYRNYNMQGGFSKPWIISDYGDLLIGGHAFKIAGYDMNYDGLGEHFIFQNSFSKFWGDNGYFYMPIKFALNAMYSRWIELDMPIELARFLTDFNGYNVKAANSPAIYFIRDGKKVPYPNMLTFLAFGGRPKAYETVDAGILAAVPIDDPMDITVAPVWPTLRELKSPESYKYLLTRIAQNGIVLPDDTAGIVIDEMLKASNS